MFWGNRQIVAAREMTKIHQELLRGTARELSARLAEPRGEFTMVVGPDIKVSDNTDLNVSDDELIAQFGQYTENAGLGRREAVSTVARKYGKPAREVYAAIERAKKAAS